MSVITTITDSTDSAILYATSYVEQADSPVKALEKALNSLDRKANEEGKVAAIERYTIVSYSNAGYMVYFGDEDTLS